MSQLDKVLTQFGIAGVRNLYSPSELSELNAAMDPVFAEQVASARAYVYVDDMQRINIFDKVLSPAMRSLIFAIMPDPVLYHCHAYEIPGLSTRSHIFSESLSGFHRDPDSDYIPNSVTHVSIFVYLTPVGPEDGAFEFIPRDPERWLHSLVPTVSATGDAGLSFVWQRGFYHRASPNRGPRRRRLIKISIQRNAYPSVHLGNENFRRLIEATPPGDPVTDLLLGRYQDREAPALPPVAMPSAKVLIPNAKLRLSNVELAKVQLRERARALKRHLKRQTVQQEIAAYD
jgi:hypothetical protein